MSNKYRCTTFSLQSSSRLGNESVQATVFGEFSSSDYNSEMQLSVEKQISYEMVSFTNDLVEKLLIRFLAQLSKRWQVWRAVATSLAAEEEGVNSLPVCHFDESAI